MWYDEYGLSEKTKLVYSQSCLVMQISASLGDCLEFHNLRRLLTYRKFVTELTTPEEVVAFTERETFCSFLVSRLSGEKIQ